MFEYIRKARQNDEGFTLIELLMVIVILGILAGIVVFAVGGITDKGQTAACKSTIETVTTAEEAYYAQGGSYTGDLTATSPLIPGFLHSAPSNVSAVVAADGKSVAVTGTGACAGVTV